MTAERKTEASGRTARGEGPAYSVVIPVYNSEGCLPELFKRLARTMGATGKQYEIIAVDDASPDGSWRVFEEHARLDPRLLAIQLMKNSGQARATICGLAHARGRIVVTMDDDLQHPPEEIPAVLAVLEGDPNADCVLATFENKRHVAYRNAASRLMQAINARAFGLPKGTGSSSFRA